MTKNIKANPLIELAQDKYLDRPVVRTFCRHLQGLFQNNPFEHGYEIDWPQWKKHLADPKNTQGRPWRVENVEKTTPAGKKAVTILRFASLKDAYDAYYWPTSSLVPATEDDPNDQEDLEDIDVSTSRLIEFDLNSNLKRLASLRRWLTDALTEESEENAFVAAMKILDWGQVYKGCVQWLIQKHDDASLVRGINHAVEILDGECLSKTKLFRGNRELRMDSGLTKVYSLAAKHSIIYDDRVGAALGLIVSKYLRMDPPDGDKYKEAKTKKKRRMYTVPAELMFMRGPSPRNPSIRAEGINFPSKVGGHLHAHSNLMANWILRKVASEIKILWEIRDMTEKLRAMESALFMLGYRVR